MTTTSPHIPSITRDFPWGPIEHIHEVGEYQIVEYHPQVFVNGCGTKRFHTYTQFHPYRDGKSDHCSYNSLDEALIGVISRKYDGPNSRASYYFGLMIGIPPFPTFFSSSSSAIESEPPPQA